MLQLIRAAQQALQAANGHWKFSVLAFEQENEPNAIIYPLGGSASRVLSPSAGTSLMINLLPVASA